MAGRRTFAPAQLDPTPLCKCGQKKAQCPHCGTWWCAAPGHQPHVCSGGAR